MKPLEGGTDWRCIWVLARYNIFEIDGGGTLSLSIDRFSSTSRIDVQAQRVACGPFCPAKFRRVSCRLSSVLIPNDSAESLVGLWRFMRMRAWPLFLQKGLKRHESSIIVWIWSSLRVRWLRPRARLVHIWSYMIIYNNIEARGVMSCLQNFTISWLFVIRILITGKHNSNEY